MEEKTRIELKSEEVQEILSRPPRALVRWGISVFFGILLLLFIGGCFFSYPDTLEAEITVTTENPPVWMVARNAGKVKELMKADGEAVKAGDIIATIENPAKTADVLLLKRLLAEFHPTDSTICNCTFPGNLSLGTIQSAYAAFLKSLTDYKNFLTLDLYEEQRQAAQKELDEYHIYIRHLTNEIKLNEEEVSLYESTYRRNKRLYDKGLISAEEHEKARRAFLTQQRGMEQMMSDLSSARIQEASLRQDIVEIELNRTQEQNTLAVALQTAYDELNASLHDWELSFLFAAPADGILSYNEVWQQNQNINSGDQVFAIINKNQGKTIGKLKLPVTNSGKVRIGQRVNISLTSYPYMEFGYLTGKIAAISLMPNEENYTVTVQLPDTLQTSYHRTLELKSELTGIAEIMTNERSFTARLLDPLKYLWEKYT